MQMKRRQEKSFADMFKSKKRDIADKLDNRKQQD